MSSDKITIHMKPCVLMRDSRPWDATAVRVGELSREWLIYFEDTFESIVIPKDICANTSAQVCYKLKQSTKCAHLYPCVSVIIIPFLVYIGKHGINNLFLNIRICFIG